MTQTFGLNSKHDIYIGTDGNLVILSGLQAVLDACETATYALLKEMIYSQNSGIPYFETVWIGSPNYAVFRNNLISTLLGIDGVLDVPTLSLSVQNGILSYTATIQTQYGTAELNNG